MYEVKQKSLIAAAGILSAVMASACGSDPVAPTPAPSTSTAPTTLKVSAPVIVSPLGGGTVNTRLPTLVLRPAVGEYTSPTVSYEIQVLTTGGDAVYSRTITGGPANGQGTVSHAVDTALPLGNSFRWRARAISGQNVGPWSDAAAGPVMFVTSNLSAASSNDDFRNFFFALIAQKNLGSTATQQLLASLEPDLAAVGIIMAKDNSGSVRGRIYLPSGLPNKYTRSVDVVTGFGPGSTWTWVFRGPTVCEGICP